MISEALRLLRVYHNIAQTKLADDLGISKSHLSEIESGKKKVSIPILERYSAYFKVPISSLFFFAEELDVTKTRDRFRGKVALNTLKLLSMIAGPEKLETNAKEEVPN
jgi:transcriptional regulator with XRE-family HTH domain